MTRLRDALARCAHCRAFTRCAPAVVVRSWRLHVAVCFECATGDDPLPWTLPVHHAPLGQLVRALFVGNVVWDVGD